MKEHRTDAADDQARIRGVAGLLDPFLGIGAAPGDSDEVRLQKKLLVASTVIMASLAVFWGAFYYAFEEPVAAAFPFSYSIASFVSLFVFSRIRRYVLFRFSQLLLTLLLPFFLMLELGGFVQSSAVILWSLTSPLGALVFAGRRQALVWFVAYLGLVVLGAILSSGSPNNLPPLFTTLFFALNICFVSVVAFFLLQTFASEQDFSLRMLDRKHRWIREAFSSYVSPNLVQHLIEHPELLQLGGERRECSFVLTDIAGFTMLVEQSDPARIVTLLNGYLEGITRIALEHGGTIDKIIGDAVAVMFSAPIQQIDHAQRAVACALAIDNFAIRFGEQQRQAGVPFGDTRIGVNSGDVIVGNVGSQSQFDYRALGDAINTASRLENANRHIGTRICVGQATVDLCSNFVGRSIGTLMLKGKSNPVAAFEPTHALQQGLPFQARYEAAFRLLTAEDPSASTAFEALHREMPEDPLVCFYRGRLDLGITGTVIRLDEK